MTRRSPKTETQTHRKNRRWYGSRRMLVEKLQARELMAADLQGMPMPLMESDFDEGAGDFAYVADAFEDTAQPAYASGQHLADGGHAAGALEIQLGGLNRADIEGMSAGWQTTFTLPRPTGVTLQFHYLLTQANSYESDEFSQVMVGVDGKEIEVDRVAGGNRKTASWRQAFLELDVLDAGPHTLVIGGYNNKKTSKTEVTTIRIDEVRLDEKLPTKGYLAINSSPPSIEQFMPVAR